MRMMTQLDSQRTIHGCIACTKCDTHSCPICHPMAHKHKKKSTTTSLEVFNGLLFRASRGR